MTKPWVLIMRLSKKVLLLQLLHVHFNYMCLISNINLKRNIEQLQVFNNTTTYTTCKFNWHMIESKVNIIWVYLNLKKPCFAYCCAFCNQPNMFKTKKIITQTNSNLITIQQWQRITQPKNRSTRIKVANKGFHLR